MTGRRIEVGRRTVLRAAAGGVASVGLLSTTGTATGQSGYGDWFSDVGNFDGTVDRRGRDAVTVEVGVEANGGPFGFGPAAVRVDPGTTVTFEWVSDNHNVLLEEGPEGTGFEGRGPIENTGFSFEHTFATEGIHLYYCEPHRSLGMKGAVVVGDVEAGTPTPDGDEGGGERRPDFGDWLTDVDGGYADARGRDAVTVEVGADGNGGPFAFTPAALWIDPGTTVTFEWVSDNHNVVPEEVPEGTGFEGHQPIENTGFSFEHAFETNGVYEYFCEPHLSLGMKGGIAVGDDVPTVSVGEPGNGGDGAADGGRPFAPPGGELGLAFVLITLGAAGLAVLSALAGEFYQFSRRPAPEEAAEEPEIVREIGHDEFDPVGTATLIVIYFLILVVMWVFVYFVEFLGRGPTVIG